MLAATLGRSGAVPKGTRCTEPRPSGLPSDRHPDRTKRAIVLEAVKVWPDIVKLL